MATTKTKTAAKKKTASVLPGGAKIHYNDKELLQKDFFAARAKTLGIEEDAAKAIFKAHAGGQEFDPGDDANLKKAGVALKKDWANHKKSVAEKKAAKEAAEKAAEEGKQNAIIAMREVTEELSSRAQLPAVQMKSKVEQFVTKQLGQHGFMYRNGQFHLKKDVKADPHLIALGFREVTDFADGGAEIRDATAVLQAKYALFVKNDLDPNWQNYFSDDEGSLMKIRQYMANLETAQEVTVDYEGEEKTVSELIDTGAIKFSTARVGLEAKYDNDKDKNLEKKSQALQQFINKGKELGRPVVQTEARNIVADLKPGAKKQLKYFYLLLKQEENAYRLIGTAEENKLLEKACEVAIDRGKGTGLINDGETPMFDIQEPTDEDIEWASAFVRETDPEFIAAQKEKPAGKPAKKAAAKKDTEPEPEPEAETPTLEELAEAADNEGAESQDELEEAAGIHGLDPMDYATWTDLVEAIREQEADDAATLLEAVEEEAVEEPESEEEEEGELVAAGGGEDDEGW